MVRVGLGDVRLERRQDERAVAQLRLVGEARSVRGDGEAGRSVGEEQGHGALNFATDFERGSTDDRSQASSEKKRATATS